MQDIIKNKLAEIEQEHGFKILFAIESGSRAWGFEGADSDYDVRFVYALPEKEYMRLAHPVDHFAFTEGDLDIVGWEVRKALNLMLKGNFTIREWLQSPIVYKQREDVINILKELAYQTPCQERLFYSYRSILKKVIHHYLDPEKPEVNLKKYFYALRSAFAMHYVQSFGTNTPPMALVDLMEDLRMIDALDDLMVEEVLKLIELKKTTFELGHKPRISVIDSFLLEHVNNEFSNSQEKPSEALIKEYDRFLYDIVLSNL